MVTATVDVSPLRIECDELEALIATDPDGVRRCSVCGELCIDRRRRGRPMRRCVNCHWAGRRSADVRHSREDGHHHG